MRKWLHRRNPYRLALESADVGEAMRRGIESGEQFRKGVEAARAVQGMTAAEAAVRCRSFTDSLKTPDEIRWCTHAAVERCYVAPRSVTRWQHTGTDPVRGRLHRTVIRGGGFYRAVCPDCGQWAADVYVSPVLPPALLPQKATSE